MASFGDRLRKRREEKGITLKQIEKDTGISNGNLSKIERKLISPSVETAAILAEYLDESLDYLARGVCKFEETYPKDFKDLYVIYSELPEFDQKTLLRFADYLLTKHPPLTPSDIVKKHCPTTATQTIKEEQSVYLPILGTAAAGMPIMTEELLEGFLPVPATKVKKNTYLIKARGDSMIEAGINNNDLVIISPQPTIENGEIALVKIDGEVTIKKFYRHEYGVKLKPANSSKKDIVISDLAKLRILGKVIGVISAKEANQKIRYEFDGPNT